MMEEWIGWLMLLTLGGGLHELWVMVLFALLPIIIPTEFVSWLRRERRRKALNRLLWQMRQLKDGGK